MFLPFLSWLSLLSIVFGTYNTNCSKPRYDKVKIPSDNTIHVANTKQLQAALINPKAGDFILLEDGVYTGKFIINNSGTAKMPITISGTENAILDGGDFTKGYVLHLKSNYCTIKGITITNGLKGIMLDSAFFNTIDGVKVTRIGEEGIHIRKYSCHNIIQHSTITYTGLNRAGVGEGIYIGSANSNWQKYTNGLEDKCDSNIVQYNTIGPFISAECIDIKEGTTGGKIIGNSFNSEGITGENSADSWMDIKGNNYTIEDNKGFNPAGSLLIDGYQVTCVYNGWGNNNIFKKNVSEVNAGGYAIHIKLNSTKGTVSGNVVYTSNKQTNAAKGLTNIKLTE